MENLTEPEKLLCEYAKDFIKNKIDKIRYDCINELTEEYLDMLKENNSITDPQFAIHILTDIASFDMDENYFNDIVEYYSQEIPIAIFKIKDKYVKIWIDYDNGETALDDWHIDFAEKKTKTIEYFE